jgi:anthranilate phosphoribosyltransferase
MNVLNNKATTAQNNVVIANAATAISVAKDIEIIKAVELARTSLESGKALKSFKKLMELK